MQVRSRNQLSSVGVDLYYMHAQRTHVPVVPTVRDGLMTTNLKWSFFLMTLSGTLIPIFKKISYAPTGSLGHSSETKVNMEFVFTFNEIG